MPPPDHRDTLPPEIEAAIADAGQALVDAWDSALRSERTARVHAARRQDAAQREADAWNATNPPRVPVIVTLDDGAQVATFTRSIAWRICDHASVLVDGISGGYLLSRCRIDLSRGGAVAAECAINLATAYHPHRENAP